MGLEKSKVFNILKVKALKDNWSYILCHYLCKNTLKAVCKLTWRGSSFALLRLSVTYTCF